VARHDGAVSTDPPAPFEALYTGVSLPIPPEVQLPSLHRVKLASIDPPPVADIRASSQRAIAERLHGTITPGMTVAVGAGSRGLTGRVEMLAGTVAGLRQLGAEPFVVPAMGSHGGATAEGQRAVLAGYGVTEETIGCEIRCSMEVRVVARTPDGMPLFLDEHAASADRIVPVNRIKPHTCFEGPVESGMSKMAVIGFGKQPGAQMLHSFGSDVMGQRLLDGVAALKATGRLAGGLATIESASGAVVDVIALSPDEIGTRTEMKLLEYAESLLPTIPFDQVDVLVVDRIGKDISGVGLDPNVTGRFWVHGVPDRPRPRITNIVALGLTPASHGNALGIGLADFTTAKVARQIDWAYTYMNCFSAGPGGVRRAKLPMVLADDVTAVRAAIAMCGRPASEPVRLVWIDSTLHLQVLRISESLLGELPPGATLVDD
jgi:hypothetical protein